MGRWLWIAAALVLPACLGPAAPTATTPPSAAPVLLRVLAVDDEFAPVPGATITFAEYDDQKVTDEAGEAWFQGLPAGNATLRGWAPAYYRTSFSVVAPTNGTRNVTLLLQRRPADDFSNASWESVAMCFAALRTGTPVDGIGCVPTPTAYWNRGPPAVFRIPIPYGLEGPSERTFHNLTARITWDPPVLATQPLFQVRLVNDSNAAETIVLREIPASSPLVIQVNHTDLPPAALHGRPTKHTTGYSLAIGPVPAGAPPQVIFRFRYDGQFDLWTHAQAPPNPSWDG